MPTPTTAADLIFSDLEKVTNTPTMYPIIEVLYEATGSKAGTVFMMMIIYFVIGCSQFNILASVSRLTWYALLSPRCSIPSSAPD
jgi:hypothetical protein